MASPGITIHVGPPKTGTTSVQAALAGAADSLQAQGVLIPRPGFGANGHLMAAFDYVSRAGDGTLPVNARSFLNGLGRVFAHEWDALVQLIAESPLPAVVSQELFAILNADGVRRLAAALPSDDVRAVAMYRPVSELVESMYQQEARMMIVPPFEQYARRALGLLVDGSAAGADGDANGVGANRAAHEYAWMDTAWLRETWRSGGVEIEIVDSAPGLNSEALRTLVARLLPAGVEAPSVARMNTGLSAYGVDVWQAHLTRTRPRFLFPALNTLEAFLADDPLASDTSLGGRYSLRAPIRDLADAAFPYAAGDRAGEARSSVIHARSALVAALADEAPISQCTAGEAARATAAGRRSLRRLRSRQLRNSALWSAGAALRRAQRRPAPIRVDWAFDHGASARDQGR